MASPSDPSSCRDQDAERLSLNPILTQQSGVEAGCPVEADAHYDPGKTLILESAVDDPGNPSDPEESDARDQQQEPSIEEGRNEEDDMEATAAADSQVVSSSSVARRGGGAKRKKGNLKKKRTLGKSQKKLEVLIESLSPVPFVPVKTLDFARHEKLLKVLGLWDFVHLEFDQTIRRDLVAQLIAFYSQEGRCSYVNDARINVNRADLARALKLPSKKKDWVVNPDEAKDILESDESIKFIEDLVSTWILLQGDDTWMMPKELVDWDKCIKEKQLDKVDFAGMFWLMVEKELKADPPLGDCYYASHMQLVIKSQKEDLLKEQPVEEPDHVKQVDLEVKEEDDSVADSKMDDGGGDLKEDKFLEEHTIELNLGQETVSEMIAEEEPHPGEEQPMDFEETKKEEDDGWLWNANSNVGPHFIRPCDVGGATEQDEENKTEGYRDGGEDEIIEDAVEEEEDEDREKHEGFPLFPNGDTPHGVAQENLMLGDASPLGYSSGLQIHGNATGGFLGSKIDMHMVPGSSSHFGNGNKRDIDHENDISYHSHNPGTKRLRTDEHSWDDKPMDVHMCLDQMEHWLNKTRLVYAEKERILTESSMHHEFLMTELQRRETMIHQLHEAQQRKDLEIYKLENELRMMGSVLEGYRKALKETQKASREHMIRCPLRDEPIYKDVKGSGGLVLTAAEIERQRLKQEEEDRIRRNSIERQINEFANGWCEKFEGHDKEVQLLGDKLTELENNVKLVKESFSKREISDKPECDATAEA
ncbi:PREDICTED: uncharacterized protein LOC104822691 [Tarenaya hassleriana]|uniref:uncharacterized protein LOC104822691 n=1 Tax=Tarenaya hassleriana TaxID=28532 RepID=UPI00053C3E33|nr:PREDICTED: uncharacterized protein LOC104822691 [Tarenaya hassleriana]XP_010552412.1 PREDICTED: uncharacterized protein LOC104822691 [Tarenaya hassleriana]